VDIFDDDDEKHQSIIFGGKFKGETTHEIFSCVIENLKNIWSVAQDSKTLPSQK